MADNAFLNATEYANSFLLLLKNQLVMGRLVTGEFTNKVTDENGLSVNIKRPPQFVAQDGAQLTLQSIVVGSANVQVNKYKNVHCSVGDLEYIQSFNDLLKNETMLAAASELAHTIDGDLHDALLDFPSSVGVPGDAIQNTLQFNKGHTRLMEQSVPNVSLNAVVSFEDGELIRGQLTGTNIDGINRSVLEKVRIPIISEINLFASQNIRSAVAGTRTATGALVTGAANNVNYRAVKDTMTQTLPLNTAGNALTFKRGDIFTIADVYAVNNRSRQPLPYLKQFVVTEDATSSAGGVVSLTISPPIIVGGTSDGVGSNPTLVNTAFQTVDSIPADNAALTFYTAPNAITPVRAAFHKRAISLVTARLITGFSDTVAFVQDPETGIGIRYWRGSDITTGAHIHRWDCVYGVQMIQPSLGVRLNGTAPSP